MAGRITAGSRSTEGPGDQTDTIHMTKRADIINHGIDVVPMGGPMQRCGAVRLRGVHIGVLLDESTQRLHVPLLCGIRRIGPSGRRGLKS